MFTMQDFHDWLSDTNKASNEHKRSLAQLSRLTREQVLDATAGLTWDVWGAVEAAKPG